ncbi:MAG: NAD-dependent epimerase/dehydratase family protein [Candidatus Krumholzibacteriota bacterium]|nr:NAD-dependent epimerase/dehydratase family protein [Candidatus Krumholzibacteriota bacterium]
MRLLILGGTRFLGRHIVEAARASNHEVKLFNRGKTAPDLFPDIETLTGDRDGGLAALEAGKWDVCVDTCGYVPRVVGDSARLLASRVGRYVFISSISVYADFAPPGPDEKSPVVTLDDETVEEVTGETYGGLKALCERAVEIALPDRALIVRPGLIVGPHDPTDRFTYWPVRVAAGGEVLAPGGPDAPTQAIDARDLAAWIVAASERRLTGVFNATGPAAPLTLEGLLNTCREVTASDATFAWVDEAFLRESDVKPFSELPCWVPAATRGMLQADIRAALAAGLTCRPLSDTVRDTLDWRRPLLDAMPLKAGLAPEREQVLLRAWRARARV